MPIIERSGRTIHFTRQGDGPGVVLVPGIGSGAQLFGTLPRRFAREGFTCCAVDPAGLPPSGPLPGSEFSFEQAALDVLAVAATLPTPTALVGVSLGGKIALQAAARGSRHADRLVMLAASALLTPRARRVYRMFERLGSEVDGRWLGDLLTPLLFGETFHREKPGVVADFVRSAQPSPAALTLLTAQARALGTFDGEALCAAVSWPALCLAGAEDVLTPPSEVEATAARIAAAEYWCVPRAGHSLMLETAETFDRVIAFLRA